MRDEVRGWMGNAFVGQGRRALSLPTLATGLLPLLIACGGAPVAMDAAVDGQHADAAAVDAAPPGLAVLGGGQHMVAAARIVTIGSDVDGLNGPTDLAFNPDAPGELWVTNHADNSMVIFRRTATPAQTSMKPSGEDSQHFLAKPSGLAFGAPGRLATSEDENQITQPTTPGAFMGTTMWPSSSSVFDSGFASHLDMLHNSPLAAGIAWDHDDVYWVFDGSHRSLTRYDFHGGHGLAGTDHSGGEVARFVAGQLRYVPGVASHLKVDHDTGLLYVADSGNDRIAVLDTATGTRGAAITPNYDGDLQYAMTGATLTTLVDGTTMGLQVPSGLALREHVLYVTDNAASRIDAFDLQGQLIDWLDLSGSVMPGALMGIAFDSAGNIFLVDNVGNRVLEILASGP